MLAKPQFQPFIIFGGPSSERLVSVATAQNLSRLLPDARCWFWHQLGEVSEVSKTELQEHARPFECEFKPKPIQAWKTISSALDSIGQTTGSASVAESLKPVFVLGLHGKGGEDGELQKLFEDRHFAFTGSGSQASRIAFNKSEAKKSVSARQVLTPPAEVVIGSQLTEARQILEKLLVQYSRLVVKPQSDGSSHGLCFVDRSQPASLTETLKVLEKMPTEKFVAEAFISGVELTVGVYDSEAGLRALPPTEVRIEAGRQFDYEGKYLGKGTAEITPAEVSESVTLMAQKLALAAHEAVGCMGYSRTDMIIEKLPNGDYRPVFLEINNLPGMTKASLIPQQLAVAKISMSDFMQRQIQLAILRSS